MGLDLIIAGGSVRAACQAAVRSGLRVAALDLFADVDTQAAAAETIQLYATSYPHCIFKELERFDHSIPLMYTGGLENYPDLIAEVEARRPLWGNGARVLRRVRDPLLLQRTLRKAGFPSIKTRPGTSPPTSGTWMRKPLNSVGGIGVQRIRISRTRRPEPSATVYWQRFIHGRCMSVAYFSPIVGLTAACPFPDSTSGGNRLQVLGTAEAIMGKDFAYQGSIYRQHGMSADWDRGVWQLGEVLRSEFQLKGFFGVDLIVNAEGVFVVEVNPRWTASMELFMAGGSGLHKGKLIVYAEHETSIPADWNWQKPEVIFADLPRAGEVIPEDQPLISVLATSNTRRGLLAELSRHASRVTTLFNSDAQ